MIDLTGNMSLSFGAQYKAEDTATYILYKFKKSVLSTSAVTSEQFALSLGITIYCDYIFSGGFSEGLGVLCLEPQCVYNGFGDMIEVKAHSIVIERDIIDSGNYKLYNYAIMSLISHYLFNLAGEGGKTENSLQLSFGLEETLSTKNVVVRLESIYENILEDKFDKVENFTLCLIMPKNRFKVIVNKLFVELNLNRNSPLSDSDLDYILTELSTEFCVPKMFCLTRLSRLNYI